MRCFLPLMLCIAAASCASVSHQPKHPHHPKPHHPKSLNRDDDSSEVEFEASAEFSELWHQFKTEHEKTYSKFEEEKRKKIFADSLKEIEDHNELYEKGMTSYTKGVTQFADMTNEEFVKYTTCLPPVDNITSLFTDEDHSESMRELFPPIALPNSMDWRAHDVVTRIKNQSQCGSCWAFAVVAALESQVKMKYGKTVYLSEQNLVDCATWPRYRCSGCGGGWPDEAFRYIQENGGIDTENFYQYEAVNGRCRFKPANTGAKVIDYRVVLPKGSETALQRAVAFQGPVVVCINASTLKLYNSGVYDGKCSSRPNHGVVAVGYGTSSPGNDYWIFKNSWGPKWGMEGYGLLARNKENLCGIGTHAVYPVIG